MNDMILIGHSAERQTFGRTEPHEFSPPCA